MSLKCCSKKAATYFTIGTFFILNGVEYAVIFPTLWLYIHERFQAPGYMMGVVVASFSLSGIFAEPLIGKWADKTRNTKVILLFANLFEIAGNCMYFMGISIWFIIASRLVCGIGSGAGSAIIADISRGTSDSERTPVLSKVMAARQFGLLIGPAFNFFLREFDFSVGPYKADAYTSPGLFLACVWSLQELQVLFMYFNLEKLEENVKIEKVASNIDYTLSEGGGEPAEYNQLIISDSNGCMYGSIQQDKVEGDDDDDDDDEEESSSSSSSSDAAGLSNTLTDSSRAIESAERFMSGPKHSTHTTPGVSTDHSITSQTTTPWWRIYYNTFLREEIVLLLFLMFITFFNQVTLETILTPLTKKYFNWEELENSILYSSCAVELLLVFIIVNWMSKCLPDRHIILIGLISLLLGMVWNLVFIPPATTSQDDPYLLVYFIVGVALLLFGMPCLATASVSLYSKLSSHSMQGISHGIRRSVINMAVILSPLWGGGMLQRLWWLFAVNTGLLFLILMMLLLSFKKLVKHNSESDFKTSNSRDSTA